MKRLLCAALILAILILPTLGLTEGADTIRLAKTLYLLGRGESYETLLDLGTVVMNRVDSPWYPDTVMGVLNQPQQFAWGTLYDEESRRAARAVMPNACGRRVRARRCISIPPAATDSACDGSSRGAKRLSGS